MTSHGSDSYHDTVSKMARKYSQYRLPHPSELVESDDEIDHVSNLSENHHMHDNEDEDEDEDLLSESNTMIYHKMSSLTLKQKQKSVSFLTNPIEEIRDIQMDKALFIDIFDKYFDESKEGDVDVSEFKKGLVKLGVDISDDQLSKLFNVLLMHGDDGGNNQYLQSEQFSDFLTRRFEAPQLIAFQDLLLNVIISKTKKNSARNTLINAQDANQWATAEVSLAEIEMRQAMEQLVDNEMEKIKIKQEFNEELERRMADPAFCNDDNAENWDCYEVALWVSRAIGNGYDDVLKKRFFDRQIDGNVLLYDVNAAMLQVWVFH